MGQNYSRGIEEEANCLGPTLLISDEAALSIASGIMSGHFTLSAASDRYGVSIDLLRVHLNVSGTDVRIAPRQAV